MDSRGLPRFQGSRMRGWRPVGRIGGWLLAWRLPPCRGSRPGVAPRGIGRGPARRGALVDIGDARTIGRRLYQIRSSHGKSLRVVAGLAGMSTTQLWRIRARGTCSGQPLGDRRAGRGAPDFPKRIDAVAGDGTGQWGDRFRHQCGVSGPDGSVLAINMFSKSSTCTNS